MGRGMGRLLSLLLPRLYATLMPTAGGPSCPEPRLPAAPLRELHLQVLGVEPEAGDLGEHLPGEARRALGATRAERARPALADPVAEAQPAAVPQAHHR